MDRSSPGHDLVAAQLRIAHGALAPGEVVALPVRSGSMMPEIPVGATVEIVACPARGPAVGDVVVFRRGSRLLAHRLVFGCGLPAPGWFVERGDGVGPAGLVRADRVLGCVVAVRRPDGRRDDLTTPAARVRALRTARWSLYRLARDLFVRPWRKDAT